MRRTLASAVRFSLLIIFFFLSTANVVTARSASLSSLSEVNTSSTTGFFAVSYTHLDVYKRQASGL